MQAEAQLRQQYGTEQLQRLAEFDTQIQSQIAQGRLNVTLGHFDYVRQLSLLDEQAKWEMKMINFQAEMARRNNGFDWSMLGQTAGAIGGTIGGAWAYGKWIK